MNIAGLLSAATARRPGSPAVTFGERTVSYADFLDRVSRTASGFRARGLTPGDRVILLTANRPELVECLLAAMWAGLVAVPLNWHLHPREVAYIAQQCDAAAIVVARDTAATAEQLDDVLTIDTDDATGTPLCELRASSPAALANSRPTDPAWLFYTSGTTGRPKGATLTHRNLVAMTLNYLADIDPLTEVPVVVHAAPLTHGSGLYWLPFLARGAQQVISSAVSFDPAGYLALLAERRATHAAFLAPTMLKRLVDHGVTDECDLSALRSIVIGGAPLYDADLRAAVASFGPVITQIYGQGESPMTITRMPPQSLGQLDTGEHQGTCGRPFTGVELTIVGADGALVAPGTDGEVCVRGDVVMAGYWNDEAATAATIRNGWLHTGDIGHLAADGHLYLTDRAKDVIITGGSNVYPREVEEALLAHTAVSEVAVVGVPDPHWGESVHAFVVLRAGSTPDAADLTRHCRSRLAAFKKPKSIVFVDSLPKNAAGKVIKRELVPTRPA